MSTEIAIEETQSPKPLPDEKDLTFGRHFTDHMFVMDYKGEWRDPRIVPYAPLTLDPATIVLHYGQAAFEGLKAHKTTDGRILLFRPDAIFKRLNSTNERLCIPPIDETFAVEAVRALVSLDQRWVPGAPGTSLYIRPLVFAADACLGVRSSETFTFIIILSPGGAYFPEGVKPVKIYVEDEYVRAVAGGTGHVKTIGNYAASLKAQALAKEKGYVQVLWLDGVERKYIEEVGSMNVFLKIGDEILTPSLGGSILPGVTRDSVIQLLQAWGENVTERRVSIQEIYAAHAEGALEEAFGTGTAAVISPIGELKWQDEPIAINDGAIGPLTQKLYDTLTGIQRGEVEDTFGWNVEVD